MPQPFLQVGPIRIYLYGVLIALSLIFLYFYAKKNCKNHAINPEKAEHALIFSLIFSVIGARVYHILDNLSYYDQFPNEVFFVWQGGLGIFGAIIGAFIGILLFSLLKKEKVSSLLNLLFPPLLLAQAIGRVGNFFNFEGFGPPTNLPWKYYVPVSERPPEYLSYSYFHPTFFYESLLCILAYVIYKNLKKFSLFEKNGFAYYLVSYGVIRFFTEMLRIDTWKISQIYLAQAISLAMIISGIFLLFGKKKKA
ncbi:prolipoprotein diacylglyceryl transferase [Patescibacteria group bacterium]|nr:prolipoprotein diacylglyceryl transferase [Patescibacteria group bacterium]